MPATQPSPACPELADLLAEDPAAAAAVAAPALPVNEILPLLRKIISARRLAANRANAQKSTGPRSAEGKQRSSLNAVRHGAWAASSLLPGESRAELAALATEFDLDFGAGGAVERQLATRVVAISWKLRRLARAEEQMALDASIRYERARDRMPTVTYEELIVDPPDEPIGAQMLADDFVAGGAPGRMQQLLNAEVRLTGQLATVCRLLLKARESGGTRAHKSGPHSRLPCWPGGDEPIEGPPELDPSARLLRRELQLQAAAAAARETELRNEPSAAKTPEASAVPPAPPPAEPVAHHSDAESHKQTVPQLRIEGSGKITFEPALAADAGGSREPSGTGSCSFRERVGARADSERPSRGARRVSEKSSPGEPCASEERPPEDPRLRVGLPSADQPLPEEEVGSATPLAALTSSAGEGTGGTDHRAAALTDECRATATPGGWHPGNPRHPLFKGPQLTPLLRQRERDIAAARVKRRAMLEAALRGLSEEEELQPRRTR